MKNTMCIKEKCQYYKEHDFMGSFGKCFLVGASFKHTKGHICDIPKAIKIKKEEIKTISKYMEHVKDHQQSGRVISDDEYVYCTNCHFLEWCDDVGFCIHEEKCNIHDPEDSMRFKDRPYYLEDTKFNEDSE